MFIYSDEIYVFEYYKSLEDYNSKIGYIGTPLLTSLLRKSLIYKFRINPNAIINFFEMRFLLKKNFSFASFIKLPKYFYHSHSNVKV